MAWYNYYLSPAGVTDPDTGWTNEANVIDGNPVTSAFSDNISPGEYTKYLYFTRSSFSCDGVRFYAQEDSPNDWVDIDLYYDGGWQPFYEGAWIADSLTGVPNWAKSMSSAEDVTQGRIRFKGVGASTIPVVLFDVYFHQEAPLLFAGIGDIHLSDAADEEWFRFEQNEFRRHSTAGARLETFLNAVVTNIDPVFGFSIDLGDIIDSRTSAGQTLNYIDYYNDEIVDNRNVPHYRLLGNHVKWLIENREDFTWAQYFAALSNDGAKSNGFPDGDNPKGYTFDVGGFRCIVLYSTYLNYVEGVEGDDQRAWLTARLDETSKPVLVFSHGYMHANTHTYGDASYAYYGDDSFQSPVRTIIENSGKVQAVFQSHYHRAKSNCVINDIPYIGLAGSTHCPLVDDEAYYIVEVTPSAFVGASQSCSRVKMTGHGNRAFDYRGDIGIAM